MDDVRTNLPPVVSGNIAPPVAAAHPETCCNCGGRIPLIQGDRGHVRRKNERKGRKKRKSMRRIWIWIALKIVVAFNDSP